MAQFIGGEEKYKYVWQFLSLLVNSNDLLSSSFFIRGIFGSAQEIYQESGISGFFKGLIPRIAGEALAIILASSVTYTVNTYIISDRRYKATFKTIAGVRQF